MLSVHSAKSAFVVESTYFLSFLKSLTDVEVEIVVIRIFDQRDDIYSLKHIGDNTYIRSASFVTQKYPFTVAVEDRDTGYRTVDKLVDDLKDGGFHSGSLKVLVRAKLEVLQGLT